MKNNNELFDIIMNELDFFFSDGKEVSNSNKISFAETLSNLLNLIGYKKKSDIEKEVAKIIYNSFYKIAISCEDKKLTVSAEAIKNIAKSVYGIDLEEGENHE